MSSRRRYGTSHGVTYRTVWACPHDAILERPLDVIFQRPKDIDTSLGVTQRAIWGRP